MNTHTHAYVEGRAVEVAGRWDADASGGSEAVRCRLQVYVLKRPYVDEFLQRMGELFECVLFTASLAKVSRCLLRAQCGLQNFKSSSQLTLHCHVTLPPAVSLCLVS